MNILKPISAALLIATSHFALADVTLNLPSDVTLLAVNMEKPQTSGSFFSSVTSATLEDGQNQIVFRFEPYFDKGNERNSVSSDVYIVTFDEANTKLDFVLPKYRTEREAEREIGNMEWSLIDEKGETISIKTDKLKKDGMQLGRNYVRESEDYNRAGGIASIGVVTTVVTLPKAKTETATKPAVVTQAEQPQIDSTAEEMLHFWYSKADADTQARFKDFINNK